MASQNLLFGVDVSNVLLAYPNTADSTALSGGAWQISLAKLQDRRQSRVARTSNCTLASTTFDVDFGKAKKLSVAAIVRHNLTTVGKWRVRLSNVANFASCDYDSGWINAWPVVFLPETLEWEDDNWWEGTISQEDRAGYPGLLFAQLPRIFLTRYIRFEFDDQTNPAGYLEFGRLFLATGWQPAYNMDYGHSIAWEFSNTKMTRAMGGTPYFDRRAGMRVHRFTLSNMSRSEAMGKIFEMQRTLGIDGELLAILDPSDQLNMLRQSFIGRLRQTSPLTNSTFQRYGTPFEVEEII